MATEYNPRIVTDNLVFYVDAGNTKSYPGTGTTWTDLTGNGAVSYTHLTLPTKRIV